MSCDSAQKKLLADDAHRILTRRKYKRLVKNVFPRNPHDSQPDDREMERLTVYALTSPEKLPKIGLYLEKRVGKKFARGEYGHLRVAIQILYALLQACHVDLRLFADSVIRLIKFLLRQDGETELQVLGCETLIKFASSQDEALQMQSLTQFVDELVRMCHDRQARPDIRLKIREAGLRAMMVLVQILDVTLSEQFGKLLPGVLVNMHVAAGDEQDRRVREIAFKVFGDICRTLKPAIAPFILRPLFAYLDGSNCWAEQRRAQNQQGGADGAAVAAGSGGSGAGASRVQSGAQAGDATGEAWGSAGGAGGGGESNSAGGNNGAAAGNNGSGGGNFVTECMQQLMLSMPSQHNYLVFIEMQQRLELCTKKSPNDQVLLSTLAAVTVISNTVRGVPGPSYYRMFLAALDLTIHALTAFKSAGGDKPQPNPAELTAAQKLALLQQAFVDASRQQAGGNAASDLNSLQELVEEGVGTVGKVSSKLVNLPQHVEALAEIARRVPEAMTGGEGGKRSGREESGGEAAAGRGEGEADGGEDRCEVVVSGVVEQYLVECVYGVARHGVVLSSGRHVPSLVVRHLINALQSDAKHVRSMALKAVDSLLCGPPPTKTRGSSVQRPASPDGFESRGGAQKWSDRIEANQLPSLLNAVLGLALHPDNTKGDVEGLLRPLVRMARQAPHAWVEHILPVLLEIQRQAAGDAGPAGAARTDGKGRGAAEMGAGVYIHGLVAGSLLALARAIPSDELEAHVSQVITLRRQAGWGGQVLSEEGGSLGFLMEVGGGEEDEGVERLGAGAGVGGQLKSSEEIEGSFAGEEGSDAGRTEGGRAGLLFDASEVWVALGKKRGSQEPSRMPLELNFTSGTAVAGGGEGVGGVLRPVDVPSSTTVDIADPGGDPGPVDAQAGELGVAGSETGRAAGAGDGLQPTVLLQRLSRAMEESPPEDFAALAGSCAEAAPVTASALDLASRCFDAAPPKLLPFSFPSLARLPLPSPG